jgi:hypothetical protein
MPPTRQHNHLKLAQRLFLKKPYIGLFRGNLSRVGKSDDWVVAK